MAVEHIRNSAGHGHGTMQRYVRLRQQVAHGESQQEWRRIVRVVQPDGTPPVRLSRNGLPCGVLDDAIRQATVALIRLERWGSVAIRVCSRAIDRICDPLSVGYECIGPAC